MGAAGEETQHACGVGGVGGLAEDVVVEGDDGVGGEYHLRLGRRHLQCGRRSLLARTSFCDFAENSFGFFAGEASDVGDGVFVGEGILGNVGGMNGERVAGLGEEFAASRRGGGEDEHELIMAGAAELADPHPRRKNKNAPRMGHPSMWQYNNLLRIFKKEDGRNFLTVTK